MDVVISCESQLHTRQTDEDMGDESEKQKAQFVIWGPKVPLFLSPNLSYLIKNIVSRIRKVNNLVVENEIPQTTVLKKGWLFLVGVGW